MTAIIDLLLKASNRDEAFAILQNIGWAKSGDDGNVELHPPSRCAAMPIKLRRTSGENSPGFWVGLCIPDDTLLEELWQLPEIVAALDRKIGTILRLKGFMLEQVNGLKAIEPVWAGSDYQWGQLSLVD